MALPATPTKQNRPRMGAVREKTRWFDDYDPLPQSVIVIVGVAGSLVPIVTVAPSGPTAA